MFRYYSRGVRRRESVCCYGFDTQSSITAELSTKTTQNINSWSFVILTPYPKKVVSLKFSLEQKEYTVYSEHVGSCELAVACRITETSSVETKQKYYFPFFSDLYL